MDIRDIKPKTNKSDKYSINLYRFLKKNGHKKIFYNKINPIDSEIIEFDPNNINIRQIMIGEKFSNGFTGTRLSKILSESRDKYQMFYYIGIEKDDLFDITDWFYKNYKEKGRCIWDSNHNKWLLDDDDRFVRINKHSRKCKYCGKIQFRTIKKQQFTKRYEKWV